MCPRGFQGRVTFELVRGTRYTWGVLYTWISGILRMTSLPSRELLESVHQFPCQFIFKAVGQAQGDFASTVIETVRDALQLEFDPPYETRETPAGRHVAVTVTPWVNSADEVLFVYERIRQVPGLVLLL